MLDRSWIIKERKSGYNKGHMDQQKKGSDDALRGTSLTNFDKHTKTTCLQLR